MARLYVDGIDEIERALRDMAGGVDDFAVEAHHIRLRLQHPERRYGRAYRVFTAIADVKKEERAQ